MRFVIERAKVEDVVDRLTGHDSRTEKTLSNLVRVFRANGVTLEVNQTACREPPDRYRMRPTAGRMA